MKRITIFQLILLSLLITGCSKEEESPEQFTSFSGIVLDQNTDEPYTNGYIEIIGSELGDYGSYRESFTIGSDGTFDIGVTSTEIHNFQINVEANDGKDVNQACLGNDITTWCTLMKPNSQYRNITVYAITYNE